MAKTTESGSPLADTDAPVTAVRLGRDALCSLEQTSSREWLVTNGIGGFAAGTLGGLNTRRYHGLLIAALRPPVERLLMVSKLDAAVRYAGIETSLATNEFADGTIDPCGYRYLDAFRLEGQIPVWTWAIGNALLEQRVWMAHGRNTTYVEYRLLRAGEPMELELKPLCTYRDYHSHHRGHRGVALRATEDGLTIEAYPGARPYRIVLQGATYALALDWCWNFKHREESARGLDDLEDLFMPALITLRLAPGERGSVILSAEKHAPERTQSALTAEHARQRALLAVAAPSCGGALGEAPGWIRQLVLAADQFIVERSDPHGELIGKTLIAGYPWFSDWGRDTMIALPGLALATGRVDVAASLLRTFASFVSEGMIPNRFPDEGGSPQYNTVDAALWYFVAVEATLRRSGDGALRRDLYPILKDMTSWHERGTRYGIRVDPNDGLLTCGENGVQLTWMDAKVGDWVVTPRVGKCVEINALWFNVLCIMHRLAEAESDPQEARRYAGAADRMLASFQRRFWFDAGGYLYDVIDGPEGEPGADGGNRDASLRPNQIFAVALRYALLSGPHARAVVDVCARELWTPVGLRSLAVSDSRYRAIYRGGPRDRDGAYHQGTVWSWLLGPFAVAHRRAHGDPEAAREYFGDMEAHLREACIGQVSEIFDGNAPFSPRGCFAQAWSVAEILRSWSELHEG